MFYITSKRLALKKLSLLLVIIYASLNASFVQAQKIKPANIELAKQCKKQLADEQLTDDHLIAINSTLAYRFYTDKKSNAIEVEVQEAETYLSLSSNIKHVKRTYFDNYQTIKEYSIKSEKNKAYRHDKICGHIEDAGIFYSDIKVCAYNIPFYSIGQVVNYSGEQHINDARYLTKIFIQTPLYNKERSIEFIIPNHLEIELKEMHLNTIAIEKESENKGNYTSIRYTISNLKGFPNEENMPALAHFAPHILVLVKSKTIDGKKINILSNTQDLYDWYTNLKSGVNNDMTTIKPLVKEILNNTKEISDQKKIEKLYYWVQDNIKYIAFEDGIAAFQPEDAQTVLYNRYGDCKGMSNLLKEMLLLAGFDARLTWVGTRRIPYNYDTPSLAVDNHMICSVILPDTTLVLDATESFQGIETIGERIQGRPVLIEDGESYILKKLLYENLKNNLIEEELAIEIDKQTLIGKGSKKLYGEHKKKLKYFWDAIDNEKQSLLMEYVVNNGKSRDYELLKVSEFNRKEPAQIDYAVKLNNQIQQFNDELYIDLDVSKQLLDYMLPKEREAPYDFKNKLCIEETVSLTIPADRAVNNLPKDLQLNNHLMDVSFQYLVEDNKIKYLKKINVLQSILKKEDFEEWNDAIKAINQFYAQQITLGMRKK